MKPLLVAINAKYIHTNMAIKLLQANTSYPVSSIEFTIKETPNTIINYILENQYDIVGFSCYIWNIEIIKQITKKLISNNITIILGGPEVSYNASYFLENNFAHYVIKNEGEEAFDALLKYLDNKLKITDVPNLYYKDGYTFDKLVDLKKSKMAYHLIENVNNRIMYIETSRGCPYKCAYCMASLDNKLRFFEIEEIKKQLLILINKGARVFKFLDRTFNANKKNFIELVDFIIEHHKPNNSFQFEITGDLLDEDVINYINGKAPKNLFRFEIGIQSTNIEANLAVGRIQNNTKLFKNILLIQDANVIDLHLDLIAGLPYEDYNSFIKTFNEVLSLRPLELQLGFLKLLHGTRLFNEKEKYGYIYSETAPYEIIKNNFMNENDINNIHICEDIFEKYYNTTIYKKSINMILDKIENHYNFFYDLGLYSIDKENKRLEDSFKVLDNYLTDNNINDYNIHKQLIIDYLSYYKLKPKAWWQERLSVKEKKDVIRTIFENTETDYTLDNLFKYSMLISLEHEYILAIYKNNSCDILITKK